MVLFDYHHDFGPGPGLDGPSTIPTSVDWVGTLVDRGWVKKVYWISGKALALPNRNARLAWLRRKTSALAPERQKSLLDRVELLDAEVLLSKHLDGPVAVTLDLDILTKNPGPDPSLFLDQIAAWIRVQNPPVVTVALSSAYQSDPAQGWAWLERLVDQWPQDGRIWQLAGGKEAGLPESGEEEAAWQFWEGKPASWTPFTGSFAPDTGTWVAAPPAVRRAVLKHDPQALDQGARAILSAWRDPDLAVLEALPEAQRLREIAQVAREALNQTWQGKDPPAPEPASVPWGFAIRLRAKGLDRGCLALWAGASNLLAASRYGAQQAAVDPRYPPVTSQEAADLVIQPTLFGVWRPIPGPEDFVRGLHSLMVVDGTHRTILQAPLVWERRWTKDEFLTALSLKAGLGPTGWHQPRLQWFRAATVWGNFPFTTPK